MKAIRTDALEGALAVSADQLERRALELFARESGREYPSPVILCGAGRLGRIALAGLQRAGVEPIAMADNNASLHGTRVNGCEVLSIENAVRRHGADAVFVTTIYTARPLRDQLSRLGARVASSRSLFFHHRDVFLPHGSIQWPAGILADADDVVAGLDEWADEASRDEYVAQIEWQLLLRTEMPSWVPPDQTYFPDNLIHLGDRESFVDCGAFDGDTVRSIIQRTAGRFDSILALEPDPANYSELTRFISTLPADLQARVGARQVAVHSRNATLRFDSGDGAGSNLTQGGDIEVAAVPLDEILADRPASFLKMDIEGAEPDALVGARATLAREAPTLAICLYHRREHLWQLPQIILDANPRYRLSLRRHSDESWETVCYGLAQ